MTTTPSETQPETARDPGPVLTARAARAADARTTDEWGLPSFALMESAGRAAADEVQRLASAVPAGEIVVLCGPGNNGGDGLVVARTLSNRGVAVRAVAVGGVERLERASEDVVRNLRLWRGLDLPLDELVEPRDVEGAQYLRTASVVVDALFGTGLARPLEGVYRAVVEAANVAGGRRVSIDVPSGLDADTGAVLGVAVRADVTVSFVAPKLGFARGEGPAHAGRVVVAEIGIPRRFVVEAVAAHPADGDTDA